MTNSITLLLTSPTPDLIAEVGRREPGWTIRSLADHAPSDLNTGPVWAFVDWLCPDISGLELCRRLRASPGTRDAHITMVIEDAQGECRRRAIEAGADDYMLGPVDVDRLFNRIAPDSAPVAAPNAKGHQLVHGDLVVDPAAHSANYRGMPVQLRPNEFRLLVFFLQHPDKVHARSALVDGLWKDARDIDERTVDVWVGRLRRGLLAQGVPDPLRTVRSVGYVLDSIA
jgi:two-component system phosphate regulon response regulator PhoB